MKRINLFGTLLLTAALSPLALAQVKIVNGPNVEQATDSSAVVAWTTDAQSSAVVHYGTDANKLDQTAQESWGGAANTGGSTHRVTLKNLKPQTTYYFSVESGQAKDTGTNAKSEVKSFATIAQNASGSATPVKIVNGPNVEQTTDTTAVVAWTTDAPSSAVLKYGTDKNNLNQTAQSEWGGAANNGGNTHRVTIKDLKPSTTYYFAVQSGQAKGTGTQAASDVKTFVTTAQNATGTVKDQVTVTVQPTAQNVTASGATVNWTTSGPTRSVIRYGTEKNNLKLTASATPGTNHSVELKNLEAGKTYYFEVMSHENLKRAEGSFQTPVTATAAASGTVSDHVKIQAGPVAQNVSDKAATLWWMTTDDTRSVVKYGKDKNNPDQTAQAEAGTSHKVTLNNLEPNTTYYFVIMSHENLKRGEGSFQTESTQTAADAKKLRIINGPVIEYVTPDTAIVAWSTNARASSIVRYGTEATNLSQSATAPWGQQTHRVTIKNLKPNTQYTFVVESSQAEGTGTMAKSNPAFFNTVPQGAQAMRNPQGR